MQLLTTPLEGIKLDKHRSLLPVTKRKVLLVTLSKINSVEISKT